MGYLRQFGLSVFFVAATIQPLSEALANDSPRDISHLMEVEYGGFRLDHSTGEFVQRLRLRNISRREISGNLALRIDNLPPNVRVANRAAPGTGQLTSPNAAAVPIPRDRVAPGATVDLLIRFANPRKERIHYRAAVHDLTPKQ